MTTQSPPLAVSIVPKVDLPEKTADLTAQQVAWIKLGAIKAQAFEMLTKDELQVQYHLKNIEQEKDLILVQNKIKSAKQVIDEAKEKRLYFTNLVKSKLVEPAMEFDKRNEALLATAEAYEFTVRKEAVAKQTAANAKSKELADLTVHIQNEHGRIAAKYRLDLLKYRTDAYNNALKGRMALDMIPEYLTKVKGFIREIKLDKFVVFERKLVDNAEAIKVYEGIPKYNPAPDLADALNKLDQDFSMYAEDLKNAEAAIQHNEAAAVQESNEIQSELEIEQATTKLAGQANQFVMTGGPYIKRKWEPVEVNSSVWALDVIADFVRHWNKCKDFVKVKQWEKLSIGQMAAALAKAYGEDTSIQLRIKMKETEK